MKIGIYFADNDFCKTVRAFLNLWQEADCGYPAISKELIVDYFNKIAPSIYWMVQNQHRHDLKWDATSYVKISLEDVFRDDEVDEYLKSIKRYDESGHPYYNDDYSFHYYDSDENRVLSF